MPNYKIGTTNPPIHPDPGAGPWGSEPPSDEGVKLKAQILHVLPLAHAYPGADAANHLKHYFENTGTPYTIRLQGLINEVPTARELYNSEVEEVKKLAQTLPEGVHQVTSAKLSQGYVRPSENKNWYYADGGYSVWGTGTVTISRLSPTTRSYKLDFEYHFYDRYNWDQGKQVTFLGVTITDQLMGEFQREGLAKEFDCVGSIKQTISWTGPLLTYTARPGDSLSKLAIKPHKYR